MARIIDNHNDQCIEYVTTCVSIVLMYALQTSRHFDTGAGGAVETETLIFACLAQVLPELVLDVVMVYFESKAGLAGYITQHWRMQRSVAMVAMKCCFGLLVSGYIGLVLLRW